MTAHDELGGRGCLGRAAANEPVFVLRGQDELAGLTVRTWAGMVMAHAKQFNGARRRKMEAKAKEALRTADLMDRWIPRQLPD